MRRSWISQDRNRVVCIVYGDMALRPVARGYSKEGNRQGQCGRRFGHPCKSYYRGPCHQPREELEGLPGDIEECGILDEEFLLRYLNAVKERCESPDERGR